MHEAGNQIVSVSIQSSKQSSLVSHVLVVGAKHIIMQEHEMYANDLESYNKRLEDLTNNRFVVRQTHTSNGSTYHGRYVYERYWCEVDQRIKQRYFGKAIPEEAIKEQEGSERLPTAPMNPLDGLKCHVIGENVIMTPEMYEKFFHLFSGSFVVPIAGDQFNDD